MFAAAFWLVHIDRQLDGRASFPRDHRPVAFPTPPPLPRLGAEVTAQQEQEDTERGDADEPKKRIFYGEHSQNIGCAKSCTFRLYGKISSVFGVQSQLRSLQPEDGDALIGCVQVRVAA